MEQLIKETLGEGGYVEIPPIDFLPIDPSSDGILLITVPSSVTGRDFDEVTRSAEDFGKKLSFVFPDRRIVCLVRQEHIGIKFYSLAQ